MTINKAKRILSELSRLGECELYIIFALITEHGFTFEDLEGLTPENFEHVAQYEILTTVNGRKSAVPRLAVWKRLRAICQTYHSKGLPFYFPLFPKSKSLRKDEPEAMDKANFDYKILKITRITDFAFTYKEAIQFYRHQQIYQLVKHWAEFGDQSKFSSMDKISMELDVSRGTAYRLLKGNTQADELHKLIKKGEYIEPIQKALIELEKQYFE